MCSAESDFPASRIALTAGAFSLAVCGAADIPTAQYDNSRTLWNGSETLLKTSNLNATSFGKVYSKAVDGWIYAQPLYLENITIPGRGTINIVYVATMHNTVYAFDADNPNAPTIWSTNLGASDTSIAYLGPELGILSTPVIVRERQALYAVATNVENGHRVFRLHALDLVTGGEKFGGPAIIGGQVPGKAADAINSVLTFDPDRHLQRTSLAVAGSNVYLAMAGFGLTPWHGWIFGYDISTLQQTGAYCDTANGVVGGIWTSGRAPAVDANGALYVETGDGDFDGVTDFGDSILKLSTSGTLRLDDWFTPDNWSVLDQHDWDLGSSAPTLIAGANRLVGGSKAGALYVLDTTNLGHIAAGNSQIVQSFQATPGCSSSQNDSCAEIHGQAFWNSSSPMLYIWAWRDVLKAYPFVGGQLDTAHRTSGTLIGNYPGGLLAGSSDGSTAGSGIVWAVTPDLSNSDSFVASAGTLRAFDAGDVTHELWNSGQSAARDTLGNFAKFVSPVVANGKVYVATFSNQLVVYGLLNAAGPALTIGKSHAGNFVQGQQNATYAVTVSNATGAGSTNGMVTVTESVPSGLTLVSMSGTGWSCGSGTCTRNDALAGGGSYPAITVTVNVGGSASSPQVNQVTVSGGGSASASASDSAAIATNSPPVPVSVSPSSGNGAAQTFAFVFTDPNGAANIVSTQMDVNTTLAVAGSCYFYYARANNWIYLANDAGSFGNPLTIGSAGTEQNSQCGVDAGASSVSLAGNTLTVNLALNFKTTGNRNIYMEAQNATLDSGWVQRGTWTTGSGGGPPAPPVAASVTPNSGNGSAQTFSFVFTDPNGAANIVSTQMDVNAALAVAGSCYFYYARANNGIYLANDAGSFGNPLTIGAAGSEQNSQCTIDAGASSVSLAGNTLTVILALSFKNPGTRNIYMEAQNATLDSGWVQRGSWTVPGGASAPPGAVSVTPSSGSGSAQTFSFVFTDPNGAASIASTQMDVNATLAVAGSCYFYYARAANWIYLANDTGSFGNPLTIGAAGIEQNSQCGVDAAASSVSLAGNTLTVNLALNFKTTGNRNIYMEAQNATLDSGWVQRGTWTTGSGGSPPAPPVAVSVTPSSGSGSAQTFSFVFTDSNGAANIVSTQMDVNATLAVAGSCYFYYARANNWIYLANDAGSFGNPLTIGSAGTVQNSQCGVDAGASSVSLAGNTLTVNLALNFKTLGTRNIYMEAQNATLDSAWVQRGTWSVP